jgi:hypothetical protein
MPLITIVKQKRKTQLRLRALGHGISMARRPATRAPAARLKVHLVIAQRRLVQDGQKRDLLELRAESPELVRKIGRVTSPDTNRSDR